MDALINICYSVVKLLALFIIKMTMKNLQRGFVVPLVVFIIAVLAIGGGVYVYESKKTDVPAAVSTYVQQSEQIEPTNSQKPTPSTQPKKPIVSVKPSVSPASNFKNVTVGLSINPTVVLLPDALVDGSTQYLQILTPIGFASSSLSNIKWDMISGSLPDGLYFSKESYGCTANYPSSCPQVLAYRATINGWAKTAGSYTFTVRASVGSQTVEKTYQLISRIPTPIGNPSVTVISPNGGESWKVGETQTIKWSGDPTKTYQITLNYPPCGSVSCPNRTSDLVGVIAQGISGNSYNWSVGTILDSADKVPRDFMTRYVVKINPVGIDQSDASDNSFSVRP